MSNLSELKSFLQISPSSDFSMQNLPYGVFVPKNGESPRVGVAIGDYVLDLSVLAEAGLLWEGAKSARYFSDRSINRFMSQGRAVWSSTRRRLLELLGVECPDLKDNFELREKALHLRTNVDVKLPIEVTGYTDFYSSIHHATNVGTLMRGAANALNPNWRWMPIAYDGRAGAVVVSGTDIHRPVGQTRPSDDADPVFGSSKALDFELEVAFVVGVGSDLGDKIPCDKADDHVFGVVLLNDWSARDIQKWEYQPLGPFLGKNFGTSISPWVVTLEALEPFRVKRPVQEPEPLEYLKFPGDLFDIRLEVAINSEKMAPTEESVLTRSNTNTLYWSHEQQLAHHTVNGCPLRSGDLYATGTISGAAPDSLGCLLELTKGGKEPLVLSNGEQRRYLNDGDTVIMRGFSEGEGYRVGFGEVRGKVLPVKP